MSNIYTRTKNDVGNFFTAKTAVSMYASINSFPTISGKIVATHAYTSTASYPL